MACSMLFLYMECLSTGSVIVAIYRPCIVMEPA